MPRKSIGDQNRSSVERLGRAGTVAACLTILTMSHLAMKVGDAPSTDSHATSGIHALAHEPSLLPGMVATAQRSGTSMATDDTGLPATGRNLRTRLAVQSDGASPAVVYRDRHRGSKAAPDGSEAYGSDDSQQRQPTATSTEIAPRMSCTDHRVPVNVESGAALGVALASAGTYEIYGELCRQKNSRPDTVHLLVHGYTLDHNYWDLPYQPHRYSYVNSAVKAGYATFNIDRLGVGQSDYPPALLANPDTHVDTVQQVVRALRGGEMDGVASFEKVILVGHSFGTWISWEVAQRYNDVDGIIASGYLHHIHPDVAKFYPGSMEPAQSDPKFADVPAGYLIRKKGTARELFYSPGTEEEVVRLADELRQTGSPTVGRGAESELMIPYDIEVPILFVVGQEDVFWCNTPQPIYDCSDNETIVERERPFFPHSSSIEAYVQPGAGHNNVQEPGSQDLFNVMLEWAKRHS